MNIFKQVKNNSRLQIFKQLLAKALKDEKYLTKARLEAAIKGYSK